MNKARKYIKYSILKGFEELFISNCFNISLLTFRNVIEALLKYIYNNLLLNYRTNSGLQHRIGIIR